MPNNKLVTLETLKLVREAVEQKIKDGSVIPYVDFDGINFKFKSNEYYTLDDDSNFASYIRVVGQVMVLVASFYITKDTLGTGSDPITIGSFRNIPNDLWGKLVAGSSGYLDEQDTQAFVDGTFNCVGSKTALVKNSIDQTLDLVLETSNMANDTQYHVRYEAVLLLTNNINYNPTIKVSNLGSENQLNVTFSRGLHFPSDSELYEEVTIDGNVFIKYPTFYKKPIADANNNLIGYEISKEKVDDDYVVYDCFLDEDGNILPYVLVGKYCMSSSIVANSVNAVPLTQTISNARTNARALGNGYQMIDCAIYCFLRDLMLAVNEKFKLPSNKYLGLEHLGSDTIIDGIGRSASGGTHYYSNKPSKYVDNPSANTEGYSALGYALATNTSLYCVKTIGYDSQKPTISLPNSATTNTDYTKYYGAGTRYRSSGRCVAVCFYNTTTSKQLFYTYCYTAFSSNFYQRLCYRPIQASE